MALLYHRFREIIHSAEAEECCSFRIRMATPGAFLFRRQVCQMGGEFCQVAPNMPRRDASPQQAFAKFTEWLRQVALPSAPVGLQPRD